MKINEVVYSNFRGGTLNVPLQGIDIITGMNGIGKTRILQAVQLAISGAVPHPIEDRNIDTVELFTRQIGKQVMETMLVFGDDRFSRIYSIDSKDGKDSVSQEISFFDNQDWKLKEAEAKIKGLLGEFPVMLDIHKFIRMSDEKRAQMMMEIGKFDEEKWNETSLRALLFEHCYTAELPTEILETALKTLSPKIKANVRAGLIDLQEYFKKQESDLKKEIKTMSATAQGAVSLNVTNGKTSMRPAATINEELEKCREDYSNLDKTIAEAEASRKNFEDLKEEKEEIEKDLSHVTDEELTSKIAEKNSVLSERIAEITDLPKLIEEIKNIDDMLVSLTPADRELCPVCHQEAGKALELSRKRLSVEQEYHRLKGIENECELIRRDIKALQSIVESRVGKQKRLDFINSQKHENAHDIDSLTLQLEALKTKGTALAKEHDERVAYDTKILQAKEAASKTKEAEANLETVKALREKIRLIRWEIVREVLEPIESKASNLFNSINGLGMNAQFKFMFEDSRGNEVFKFGWHLNAELGEMFVDFDSLSTAQQLFTLAAIMSPIIELGNPKLKLLMFDNCEVIHPDLRERFLHLLIKAKELCNLDNIIIASSDGYGIASNLPLNELNFIDLKEEAIA